MSAPSRAEISKISSRELTRLRPADPDEVAKLIISMGKLGQLHPITIYESPNEAKGRYFYVLVAGLHRLKAAEQLGWSEIDVKIVAAAEARTIQVEENLCRADLTALDRAVAVREWRREWESKHGEIPLQGGRPAKNCEKLAQFSKQMLGGSWSAQLADQMGCSRRSVMLSNKISQIDESLREALRGTPYADNQALLLKIAKIHPDRQAEIAHGAAERGWDIKQAISNPKSKDGPGPLERLQNTVLGALKKAEPADRVKVFEDLWRQYGTELQAAHTASSDPLGGGKSDVA